VFLYHALKQPRGGSAAGAADRSLHHTSGAAALAIADRPAALGDPLGASGGLTSVRPRHTMK
jgi:hypothetical protein